MSESPSGRKHRVWSPWMTGAAAVLALAVGVVGATGQADAAKPRKHTPVPVNTRFEAKTGIRITRIAMAADNGLVDVRFVVLDPQKANRFLGDSDHTGTGRNKQGPPKLRSKKRNALINQLASMHMHAQLVPGQTYSLIYLNPKGKVHAGDTLDLSGGTGGDTYTGIAVE